MDFLIRWILVRNWRLSVTKSLLSRYFVIICQLKLRFAAIIVATTQKPIRISRHSNIIVISCILSPPLRTSEYWVGGDVSLYFLYQRIFFENIFLASKNISDKYLWRFLPQIKSDFFRAADLLLQKKLLLHLTSSPA